MTQQVADGRHRTGNRGKAVPLELFFDLVFVFAITQVTGLLSSDPTWIGLGRGLAVLTVLWWAWVGYSWLASAVDPEEGWMRLAFFAAMAAMFVVALATGEAFGAGAVTFAVAYLVVRLLHIGVFFGVSNGDASFRRAVWSMAPSFTIGPAVLLIASLVDGPVRGLLWAAALTIDLGGALLGGTAGWRLNPAHFAERHGLIIIIALGEAIVSVGVGADAGIGVSAEVVVIAVAIIAIAAALWWAYFDVVAIVAERRLTEATGAERNGLARDSFSYLHLPLVAGIVLLALGAKKTTSAPTKELETVIATALGGGAALIFATLSMLRKRNIGKFNVQRLVAAVVIPATVIPLARYTNSLIGLVTLAVLMWILISYEAIRLRALRHEIRHGSHS